ncbi:MAG: hypothetical protein LUG23_05605 [Oscillospiraceae bacterium]|nr:hypothetical protein [Oscillospiraceae bacterium]MCD7889371.1 hypothetical protein [Oscillospiraceae bacterium]
MLSYLAALALGLIGIYKLREGLLIIQNYNDAKEEQLLRAQIEADTNIISKNSEQCKTFKQAV